ncbi:pSer/pThr/pTyr-binding forkhead associated (FHA) protein [Rathayibacter tanaceti]|uniref:FHA domain-containing protein n=2 Tax=Rathayibacter tanaceti TaxID=1671680 RepID=A0AAE6RK95_9MICO|nr:FHA domain-containing protein [Rathayibacter tanaceti]QHC56382.1 FHA domain-containing protein [Rathayibacter tanaceti]TCO34910.1 pSer/pThr/pTyr-binding forkhead associated (FHA) protein [Rathayibacter tanaceti]
MSFRCPEGHTSASGDYCDVCGAPIGAPSSPPPAAAAPTTAIPTGPSVCPHCSFPNEPGALFCENCGYDFTTGSLPEVDPFTESGALRVPGGAGGSATAAGDPASHLGEAPRPGGDPAAVTELVPEQEAGFDVPVATAPPVPSPPAAAEPPTEVIPSVAGSPVAETLAPEAPADPDRPWIAELWVDPDWYAEQRADDPMPSPGPPATVVLRERSLLVGRPSVSRGISPQIDCGSDSGVSRRHCQLSTDGYRWWVEDLQSANGTYLAQAGAPIPQTPIPAGQRREVEEGDRLYVGAWTRLVLRPALPGEA